jgi:hypothetical protein
MACGMGRCAARMTPAALEGQARARIHAGGQTKFPSMPSKRKPSRRNHAKAERPIDMDDPHWIAGIHHYCDRWCERCDFSHRCLKFAVIERLIGDDTSEARNRTSFAALARVFDEARIELDVATGKASEDDLRVGANVAVEKRIQRRAHAAGGRETNAALTYAHMVDEWFNNELKLPLRHVRDLKTRVENGLVRVADAKGELVRLNDCVEIIRWHQHLPYVKLSRAFTSRVEEEAAPERGPRDSDGSAKVALIALDRSIAAWSQLRDLFPEKTDSFLEILVHLDRLRRAVLVKFPRARRFKRPGFDENPPRTRRKPKPRP